MVEVKEFPLLSKMKMEYKNSCYKCRYSHMMKILDDVSLQEIKELIAYAKSNLDVLGKTSLAITIINFLVNIVDNGYYTLLCMIMDVFYFCFAIFNVKKHYYIIMICEEKIKDLEKPPL